MGKVSYLFADFIKDLSSSDIDLVDGGGSAVDSNYPITNLQNEQIALRTFTDAKVAVKLQFDLGSSKQLQAFFMGNHNFSGGTFDINSYTAGDYSTGKTTVEAAKAVRLLDVYHYESSAPATRRYWEIDLTNVTSNDSVFKIGRFMCHDGSNPVQLTDIPDFITARGYGFRNIINVTSYGVRWAHKLTEDREQFEIGWRERTSANAIHTELRTLYKTVNGNASPFVYIPDITQVDCYYVAIIEPDLLYAEIHNLSSSDSHVGRFALKLLEEVRGKV